MPTAQACEYAKEVARPAEWTETKDRPASWEEPRAKSISNVPNVEESDVCKELKAEIEQGKRILELEDDWDGEGSLGYSKETLNRAESFLKMHIEGLWKSFSIRLPIPKIGPGPDGSIDLYWKQSSWELLVNIPADAHEMATFYGDNYGSIKNRGNLDPTKFNLGFATWLMN
jgi:hypothetical protein